MRRRNILASQFINCHDYLPEDQADQQTANQPSCREGGEVEGSLLQAYVGDECQIQESCATLA